MLTSVKLQSLDHINMCMLKFVYIFLCSTGKGLIEKGLDRHEQLKLQAQQQGLLEAGSCQLHDTHNGKRDQREADILHDDDEDLEAIE